MGPYAFLVTPARYHFLTRAALWSLTIIVVTGAAVRLTGSGLGCSDWPNCEEDKLVPDASYHGWIEFGNRLFTGVVGVVVIVAVLGSLRRIPRRRDLTLYSWGLVVGVIAQALLGKLLVESDLDPRFTMGHFLLSMVLLWNAAVLQHRASIDDDRIGDGIVTSGESYEHRRRLQFGRLGAMLAGAALLVTGTIVTGSGPHAGSVDDEVAPRLPFLVRDVTRIHSLSALALITLVAWIGWRARQDDDAAVQRRVGIALVLLVAQATVGYVQYFTGVPVLLVAVHVTLASLAWIALVRLHVVHEWLRPRVREPVSVS